MDLELKGKTALITGGSKGIGRAVAHTLAEEGCDLILVSRDERTLAVSAQEIRNRYQVRVSEKNADLSQQSEVERVAASIEGLDILINNAGAIPSGALKEIDNERWRAAWDLKVFGYIGLCRALYTKLQPRRGVIVNIIGAAGERFDPGYIAGAAGNAALMAFTKALGVQAVRDGMRVVAINPGPVHTDRMIGKLKDAARKQFGDESRWAELTTAMSYGRAAKPEEIAAAAAFLASPKSGYTTGTVLTIDGANR
ncbi:General stress protein 39 [Alphaproteobacteria bacterium SO-S41]|nr:General stress protein 39 [Alphaproteobacteria bacterium SO-S41]